MTATTLVTGGTGLLGRHVVDLLVEQGVRPLVLVEPGHDGGPHDPASVEACTGDIRDRASLEVAVAGVEHVLHCAARTGPWGPEREYEDVNVRALETLAGVASAAGVRRIVHVSSVTVHGNDVRGSADEDAPFRIEPNPYSRSKVAGERLLQRLTAECPVPITIVRPGWIYGPNDLASFARTAAMVRDGRMVLLGSGRNHLPVIYVTDAADGVIRAAAAGDRPSGRAYILVNDESVTQREYLDAIANALGVAPPKRRIPYRLALTAGAVLETAGRAARMHNPPPLTRYGVQLLGGENRFSIDRARRELGFSPQVGVAEGVRRSIDWFRNETDAPARVRSG
jgi:nucleoside-diphosphate-sugar epimerase